MTGLHPNTELVAIAWIRSIAGGLFASNMVATQPPAEQSWPQDAHGVGRFITVTTIGGSPRMGVAIAEPIVEVKAYATKPGSNKPPWFAANYMLQQIWLATLDRTPGVFGRALTISQNGVAYAPASAIGAVVHTEPRRIYSDARNWAAYMMDMSFTWREVGLVTP